MKCQNITSASNSAFHKIDKKNSWARLSAQGVEMTTPEEALDAYSPFGSDAINLLKTARANGKPAWVAPEMSLADQLQLCALSVKGKSVTATYMCGDSGTQQRLSNFMAKLYRVAGMEDVFVKGANEHDA